MIIIYTPVLKIIN